MISPLSAYEFFAIDNQLIFSWLSAFFFRRFAPKKWDAHGTQAFTKIDYMTFSKDSRMLKKCQKMYAKKKS